MFDLRRRKFEHPRTPHHAQHVKIRSSEKIDKMSYPNRTALKARRHVGRTRNLVSTRTAPSARPRRAPAQCARRVAQREWSREPREHLAAHRPASGIGRPTTAATIWTRTRTLPDASRVCATKMGRAGAGGTSAEMCSARARPREALPKRPKTPRDLGMRFSLRVLRISA
jgi:hypothetical protein